VKLSTRSTYGLRALAVLACKYGQGPVLLRDIVEVQQLPTTYLEQLMVLLRKSGLVSATRGVNGGYRLTRDPREVTLAEVIKILEGPINLVECSAIVNCDRRPECCALREYLDNASTVLTDYLTSVTLHDLCTRQHNIDDLVEVSVPSTQ
jgi:Rrf2 family cysteine metabolism transcriptional repressor